MKQLITEPTKELGPYSRRNLLKNFLTNELLLTKIWYSCQLRRQQKIILRKNFVRRQFAIHVGHFVRIFVRIFVSAIHVATS